MIKLDPSLARGASPASPMAENRLDALSILLGAIFALSTLFCFCLSNSLTLLARFVLLFLDSSPSLFSLELIPRKFLFFLVLSLVEGGCGGGGAPIGGFGIEGCIPMK